MMEFLLCFLVWYAFGVWSFVFWWTGDYDLTMHDLLFGFFVGLLGPFIFFIGWSVHGNFCWHNKTLIKKRKR